MMTEKEFNSLDPTIFFRGTSWFIDSAATRKGVVDKFKSFYSVAALDNPHDYDLDRISTGIFYLRTFLERQGLCGHDKIAVEIGCGIGNKSFCINDLFQSYYGVDLDANQVQKATDRAKRLGANNTRFFCTNVLEFIQNKSKYSMNEKIDLLILYAVLEHLTLKEREEIIQFAEAIMLEGGSVLVMETPNRLIPTDSHTSGVHYLNHLPDDLAIQYWKIRGNRTDMCSQFRTTQSENAFELLYRFGRGVSFHEFETGLKKSINYYNIFSNSYEVEMLNIEPLTYQEVSLLGDIQANIPSIDAFAFSRCWIDIAMSIPRRGPTCERRFISAHWPDWLRLSQPSGFYEPVCKQLNAVESIWRADLDIPDVIELVIIFSSQNQKCALRVIFNDIISDTLNCADLYNARPNRWHNSIAVAFKLNQRLKSIIVEFEGEGTILFQGCVISSLRKDPVFTISD